MSKFVVSGSIQPTFTREGREKSLVLTRDCTTSRSITPLPLGLPFSILNDSDLFFRIKDESHAHLGKFVLALRIKDYWKNAFDLKVLDLKVS